MRDVLILGSTCKALEPLRKPWDVLSIDLKKVGGEELVPSLSLYLLLCFPNRPFFRLYPIRLQRVCATRIDGLVV